MCDFVMLLYKKHRFFIKNFNNKHKKNRIYLLIFFFFLQLHVISRKRTILNISKEEKNS